MANHKETEERRERRRLLILLSKLITNAKEQSHHRLVLDERVLKRQREDVQDLFRRWKPELFPRPFGELSVTSDNKRPEIHGRW